MAAAKKTVPEWECVTKCFANGELYREGDTVTGGDFSKNDNFKKIRDVPVDGSAETAANGSDIPHTETGTEGSN